MLINVVHFLLVLFEPGFEWIVTRLKTICITLGQNKMKVCFLSYMCIPIFCVWILILVGCKTSSDSEKSTTQSLQQGSKTDRGSLTNISQFGEHCTVISLFHDNYEFTSYGPNAYKSAFASCVQRFANGAGCVPKPNACGPSYRSTRASEKGDWMCVWRDLKGAATTGSVDAKTEAEARKLALADCKNPVDHAVGIVCQVIYCAPSKGPKVNP